MAYSTAKLTVLSAMPEKAVGFMARRRTVPVRKVAICMMKYGRCPNGTPEIPLESIFLPADSEMLKIKREALSKFIGRY